MDFFVGHELTNEFVDYENPQPTEELVLGKMTPEEKDQSYSSEWLTFDQICKWVWVKV